MSVSVTFTLGPDDARVLAHGVRTIKLRTAAAGVAIIGAVIGGGVFELAASALDHVGDSSPWWRGALPGMLGAIWIAAMRYERAMVPAEMQFDPTTLTVTNEGLTVENRDFRANHVWESIASTEEKPEHLVIRTRQTGVFLIPRRAFANSSDQAAFLDAVRRGIAANSQTMA